MAGAMWAVRNLTQALANQLVFMRTQREDGRLPGMVETDGRSTLTADYCIGKESLLQGNYFSTPAVDVAAFLGWSGTSAETIRKYVAELHVVLERFDGWMWRARVGKGPLSDTLWTPSATDWGGDGFDGYEGYSAPFTSMDMMSYAHSNGA